MMNQPTFSKNLPAPVRMLIRPMLYFSMILHGGFLLIPLPEPPPEVAEVEPEPVAVRPLSPSPSPSPSPTPTPPAVQPPPSPVVTPPPTPVVQSPPPAPRRPSPPPPQPTPPPEIDPFLGAELFETPPPSPTPEVVQTPEPTPTPEVVQTPSPTPEVVQTPEPTPTPEVAELPEDPLAEFPHITGAQTGCQGQCWQIQQRSTSVARNLLESLEAKGFTIRRTDGDRTGERIYEVSKDGEVQYYISLFSTLDGGTKYAIADAPLTREDLANLNEELSP
ncbi:MAG: hypothetical protein F6K32_16190 [Desertifilum sp. SIO1I2]|nr:hypothetical protein [Desertifilum sp. SIO1I2]